MGFHVFDQQRCHGRIRGVLFDMDGVVLDTEKLYMRFWREAAIALGYPMTDEQAMGMRSLNNEAGQAQLESYFGPGVSRKALREKRIELMDAYIQEHGVELKPGVFQLLDYLKAQKIPTAITTSSPMERVRRYLGSMGLTERFDCLCSGHDVPKGKPEPDIYLYGAHSVGIAPEECLALEDSYAGIVSAHRAGCLPVMVPDLDEPDEATKKLLFARCDHLDDVINLIRECSRR
jgi:HAD superfamily hydrolase (TIGR01509 family)